jgi:hypothetical protein
VLGEKCYDKQLDILKAVGQSRRTSVVGCNGSGKDWAAARAMLWWMNSRYPAKAIVTGPTNRQVDDIVWNEVRSAYSKAAGRLDGKMFQTCRYELDDQTFALGFSTNSPWNLQGFHSPNLLVIITEAHAVNEDDINAIRRLNPSRLLMTGNPFITEGVFYDSHHTKKELYNTVNISAFDTPNIKEGRIVIPGMITRQDIEDRKEEWGEDSPMYIGGVLGEFPENLEDTFVPLWAATQAAKRQLEPEGPVILACDVARYGEDKTVVMRRQGPVARIIWRVNGKDTMTVANFLKDYCDANEVNNLVVDEGGVGAGVVDRLREVGLGNTKLTAFNSAKSAGEGSIFVNAITAAWNEMGKAYARGELDTDDDPALIGQVANRRYEYVDKERIRLKSKKKMSHSPDEADALAMTYAITRKGDNTLWV